ncbi:hypothetical protein [Plantactinospora sonchi]|uniref:Uncharacterized protein n=1 Tax=Plantactinospora sonchi TaxID=1544735 RepID=A0ABU7RXL4_9ACTN
MIVTTAIGGLNTLIYLAAIALLIGAVLACRGPRQVPDDGFGALVPDQSSSGSVAERHVVAGDL